MSTYAWIPTLGTRLVSSSLIPVTTGTKVVFVGDSLTAGGYFDQTQSINGGVNLLVQQLATAGAHVNAINSGVNGNTSANIAAAIASRITNYHPDVVVLFVGLNDCATSVALATYTTNMTSIITTTKATLPSVRMMLVGIILDGERWASGPVRFAGNSFDTGPLSIDAYNAVQVSLAATYGCTYVETRAPFATLESQLNTPEPGVSSGVLTLDGIHVNGTGQFDLSTILRPSFVAV